MKVQIKNIFVKITENGGLIPAGTKFAKESLNQWFRKQTGRLPNSNELDKLMKVWGDAGHINFSMPVSEGVFIFNGQ